jgi:hypothetical protein
MLFHLLYGSARYASLSLVVNGSKAFLAISFVSLCKSGLIKLLSNGPKTF